MAFPKPKQDYYIGQYVLMHFPKHHRHYSDSPKKAKITEFKPETINHYTHYGLETEDGKYITALPESIKPLDITEEFSKVKVK